MHPSDMDATGSRALGGLQPKKRITQVSTVALVDLPCVSDERGALALAELGQQLPFVVERYFSISAVTPHAVRGEHAHRELHQFLICVHGAMTISVDDGSNQDSFRLHSPTVAVHLKPMTWCRLMDFTVDAVAVVLASAPYDPDDYIRDYAEFLQAARNA